MIDGTPTGQIGRVIATDGTPITYRRTGAGPPLVLVHGAAADRTRWAPVLPALEERFTVYALDRRGRGASGDAPTYAIEREFEDIAVVVDTIGGPVDVLGHSFGALCALEAALRSDRLRRLVLYEPPIPTGSPWFPSDVIARLQAHLAAGDRDALLVTFFREAVAMPPDEIELMRGLPVWEARRAVAHTIARELHGAERYVFEPARFRHVETPTLLLLGGDSPPFFTAGTEAVHAAVPQSRIAVLPGQQHIAMNTAPELFLRTVLAFLTSDGPVPAGRAERFGGHGQATTEGDRR
jgi:pimeloyl-ACP methyl ester carboxylesterase